MKNCNLCSEPAELIVSHLSRGVVTQEHICSKCLGEYALVLLETSQIVKLWNLDSDDI
jgi:protein-arginine kinase activator protein McsA